MNREPVAEPVRNGRILSPSWTLFILTGLNLFNYLDRFVLPGFFRPFKKTLRSTTRWPVGPDGVHARILRYFAFFGYLGDRAAQSG